MTSNIDDKNIKSKFEEILGEVISRAHTNKDPNFSKDVLNLLDNAIYSLKNISWPSYSISGYIVPCYIGYYIPWNFNRPYFPVNSSRNNVTKHANIVDKKSAKTDLMRKHQETDLLEKTQESENTVLAEKSEEIVKTVCTETVQDNSQPKDIEKAIRELYGYEDELGTKLESMSELTLKSLNDHDKKLSEEIAFLQSASCASTLSSLDEDDTEEQSLLRRLDEKLEKAAKYRQQILSQRRSKIKLLRQKIALVNSYKKRMIEDQRDALEKKMRTAEENRLRELQKIVDKAREEDEKINEVAFIKNLDIETKRYEINQKMSESEVRLRDMQEERQRRQYEHSDKIAAAVARREEQEIQRIWELKKRQERKRQRQWEFEEECRKRKRENRARQRDKERNHKQRIAALNAKKEQEMLALREKIEAKDAEIKARQTIYLKTVKSVRSSSFNVGEKTRKINCKLCTACNTLIPSEIYVLDHLYQEKHRNGPQSAITCTIIDVEEDVEDVCIEDFERQRMYLLKENCAVMRDSIISNALTVTGSLPNRVNGDKKSNEYRLVLNLKIIQRKCADNGTIIETNELERNFNEILRIFKSLNKSNGDIQRLFYTCGGFSILFKAVTHQPENINFISRLSSKLEILCLQIIFNALDGSTENCLKLLNSAELLSLVHLLLLQLSSYVPMPACGQNISISDDSAATMCLKILSVIFKFGVSGDKIVNGANIFSYFMNLAIFQYISCAIRLIGDIKTSFAFIIAALDIISSFMCWLMPYKELVAWKDMSIIFQITRAFETIDLLHRSLLSSEQNEFKLQTISDQTVQIALSLFRFLNNYAVFDVSTLQTAVSDDVVWLQFRYIISNLMQYCCANSTDGLLQSIILLIGHFASLNSTNQEIIQSGKPPTILQQLCNLPFKYFSDPRLVDVLFPTLIACCYNNDENTRIVSIEFNCTQLGGYVQKHMNNHKTMGKGSCEFDLHIRVPFECWFEVISYFKNNI